MGLWAALLEEQLDVRYMPGVFACLYSRDLYVAGFRSALIPVTIYRLSAPDVALLNPLFSLDLCNCETVK